MQDRDNAGLFLRSTIATSALAGHGEGNAFANFGGCFILQAASNGG